MVDKVPVNLLCGCGFLSSDDLCTPDLDFSPRKGKIARRMDGGLGTSRPGAKAKDCVDWLGMAPSLDDYEGTWDTTFGIEKDDTYSRNTDMIEERGS